MKYTQKQWFEIIDGYADSDFELKEYCKEKKIAESTYYKYKKIRLQTRFLPVVLEKQKSIPFVCNGIELEVKCDIDSESLALLMIAARRD